MKKLLLGLGSIAAVVAPIAAVVSCGSDDLDLGKPGSGSGDGTNTGGTGTTTTDTDPSTAGTTVTDAGKVTKLKTDFIASGLVTGILASDITAVRSGGAYNDGTVEAEASISFEITADKKTLVINGSDTHTLSASPVTITILAQAERENGVIKPGGDKIDSLGYMFVGSGTEGPSDIENDHTPGAVQVKNNIEALFEITGYKTPSTSGGNTGNTGNTGGNTGGTVVTPTDTFAEGTAFSGAVTTANFDTQFAGSIANAAKAASHGDYQGVLSSLPSSYIDVPAITNPTAATPGALITALGGYTAVKKFTKGNNTIFLLTKSGDVRANVAMQTGADGMEITYNSTVTRPRKAGIEADFGKDAYDYIENNQNVVGMLAFYNGANAEPGATTLYAHKVYFLAGFKNDTTQNKVFVEGASGFGAQEVSITAKAA